MFTGSQILPSARRIFSGVIGCELTRAPKGASASLMARAGFACAPANAHAEVRAVAHHVTAARGGDGAARECCDLLLMAAGRYASLLQGQMHTLDGV